MKCFEKFRIAIVAAITLGLGACTGSVTGPEDYNKITMSPVLFGDITVGVGGSVIQYVTLCAPGGIDPDLTASVEKGTVASVQYSFYRKSGICDDGRVAWTAEAVFVGQGLGASVAVFSLKADSRVKSTFLLTVVGTQKG